MATNLVVGREEFISMSAGKRKQTSHVHFQKVNSSKQNFALFQSSYTSPIKNDGVDSTNLASSIGNALSFQRAFFMASTPFATYALEMQI
jgi:hypothetical protein